MANEIERSKPQTRPMQSGLEVAIQSASLQAKEIALGDVVTLDELRLDGKGITLSAGADVKIAELNGSFTISETALNRFLGRKPADSVRDLKVAMLNGKVRISGRYPVALGFALPFTFTAVPEIDGGARLRLDPRQMSLVGAPIPGVAAQVIGEAVNKRLAEAFDVTRFPLAVRLTGLTVETGRLHLTATASIELRR